MEDNAVNSILNIKSGQVKRKYAAKPEDLRLHEEKIMIIIERLLKALDLEHADKNEMNRIRSVIKALNYPPEVYKALKKYYTINKSCGYAPNCGDINKCLFVQQFMWFVLQNGNSYPVIDETYTNLTDNDKLGLNYGTINNLEILAKECGGEEIEKLRAMKMDLELKNNELESKLSQLLAENNTNIMELQTTVAEANNEIGKLKIELELCNKLGDISLSNKDSELLSLKLELDAAKTLSNSLSENNKELSERFSKETIDAAKRFDEYSIQYLKFQAEARDASISIEQKLRDAILSEAVACAKITELQKTVDTLTNELSDLKGQLDSTISIAGKYSILESENMALLAKVTSGEEAIYKLNESHRELAEKHSKELERIALEDAVKLEQAEKKVTDLYNKCLIDGKTNLDNVANELQKDKNVLQTELSNMIETKTTLVTELANARTELKNSEDIISELNNEILDHSTKTTALSVEIGSLQKTLEDRDNDLLQKDAEIVHITEKFVQSDGLTKATQSEIISLNKKISEQELSISKQSDELSATRSEITKLLGESSELKQLVANLNISLSEKATEFDLQAKLLATSVIRNEELNKNLTDALNITAELTSKINTLEPQLSETKDELKKCHIKLTESYQTLEEKTKESTLQAEQIKHHLSSISELQKKSDICDDSLSKVTAKFDDVLGQKNKLNENLSVLSAKNDTCNKSLEQKIKALDNCNINDAKLSEEIVQFKQDLEQKNSSATDLERKFNILMKRIKSFQKAKLPEMKLTKKYTPFKLVKMSVVSLKLVARSMNIPSSGTKDMIIRRILKHK
jgi:DNA repair exonuclease SbcCD ATPase subunit